MAKVLFLEGGKLVQGDDATPADIARLGKDLHVIRYSRDQFEVGTATYREVDSPTNSFDETRQDQAIDGKIWEIESWQPVESRDMANQARTPGDANIKAEESLIGKRSETGVSATHIVAPGASK